MSKERKTLPPSANYPPLLQSCVYSAGSISHSGWTRWQLPACYSCMLKLTQGWLQWKLSCERVNNATSDKQSICVFKVYVALNKQLRPFYPPPRSVSPTGITSRPCCSCASLSPCSCLGTCGGSLCGWRTSSRLCWGTPWCWTPPGWSTARRTCGETGPMTRTSTPGRTSLSRSAL